MRISEATETSMLLQVGDVDAAFEDPLNLRASARSLDEVAPFGMVRTFLWFNNHGCAAAGDFFALIDHSPAAWLEVRTGRIDRPPISGRILVKPEFRGRALGRYLYLHALGQHFGSLMSGPSHTQHSKAMYERFATDANIGLEVRDPATFDKTPYKLTDEGILVDGISIYEHPRDLRFVVKARGES